MSSRRALLFFTSYLWFFSVSVHAQEMSVFPRLSDGRPNLQGVWDFRTLTPLQRPQDQENSVLSFEEAAEIEARSVARTNQAFSPSEVRDEPLPAGGAVVRLPTGSSWEMLVPTINTGSTRVRVSSAINGRR